MPVYTTPSLLLILLPLNGYLPPLSATTTTQAYAFSSS
ncbi:Protein CBG27396 [Caenorhabditis briggsae]|uniref:Protein CBG27396 n=1 Tax=Caenorhabditis briggsae TaxID=6238 RepID=B6IJX3_CAEBR|nr:Protein CBG27396 [Caenorhabditis briggsae]CAS00203.1 Protein CBG27396 [Caenorhabditis briggsae]